MGLHCNLMADEELRNDILKLIREQMRPLAREQMAEWITPDLALGELKKLVNGDILDNLAKKMMSDIAWRITWDQKFQDAIFARLEKTLNERLKPDEKQIEELIARILRRKFGGIGGMAL